LLGWGHHDFLLGRTERDQPWFNSLALCHESQPRCRAGRRQKRRAL
jgi:hypothetical protein